MLGGIVAITVCLGAEVFIHTYFNLSLRLDDNPYAFVLFFTYAATLIIAMITGVNSEEAIRQRIKELP